MTALSKLLATVGVLLLVWIVVLVVVGSNERYVLQAIVAVVVAIAGAVVFSDWGSPRYYNFSTDVMLRRRADALADELTDAKHREAILKSSYEARIMEAKTVYPPRYEISDTRALCVECGLDVFRVYRRDGEMPIKLCEGHPAKGR